MNQMQNQPKEQNLSSFINFPLLVKVIETLSPEVKIIAYLKLGYINDTVYETKEISNFLGIEETRINGITKEVLTKYKEYITYYIDDAIDNLQLDNLSNTNQKNYQK